MGVTKEWQKGAAAQQAAGDPSQVAARDRAGNFKNQNLVFDGRKLNVGASLELTQKQDVLQQLHEKQVERSLKAKVIDSDKRRKAAGVEVAQTAYMCGRAKTDEDKQRP